jgi:hypothetical protein
MIRNLLYSLSLHLLLILVIYLNFNSTAIIEIKSLQEPITVSVVALKEEVKSELSTATIKSKNKSSQIKNKSRKSKKRKDFKEKKKSKEKKNKKVKKPEDKKQNIPSKNLAKNPKENKKSSDVLLSARQRFNIELHIRRCYRKAVKENAATSNIALKISVNLKITGLIDLASIKILNKDDFKSFADDIEIALKNAKRTLELCSPVRNLPLDKYEIWRELEFEFKIC